MISNIPDKRLFLDLFTSELIFNSAKAQKAMEDNVAKIKQLMQNREIQNIECPGPNKFLLIKKNNEIDISNIKPEEGEIRNIINDFAKKSRVPFTGGILNTAVDNLRINALESEFAGSRFIITRLPRMVE